MGFRPPFRHALRTATPVRMALAGPAGSGKTYTALALAAAFGGTTAVVDTNRRSASLYAGLNGWEFDTVAPTTFSPESLVELIIDAADAGYDNLIVDTWSHYWFGPEGMLEQVDARSRGANQHQGWKDMRPAERAMLDALLGYPGNVIVTLRVKTEVVVEPVGDNGRAVPRRVGLKPEQRDGLEYDFDLYCDMDSDHGLIVTKSRVPDLASTWWPLPGADFADKITAYLSAGRVVPTATELRNRAMEAATKDEINTIGVQADWLSLLQATVRAATGDGLNTLENVLIGRKFSLPTADELAAATGEPAPDETPDPDPEQPPAGEAWQQPDVPTPDYITGQPQEEK
jgi:hypothetical protein